MAAKYVELNQAAKQLGVSPDKLNDLRLSGKIHGVRDGATWKFKEEELQKYMEENGISSASGEDDDLSLDFEPDRKSPPNTSSSDLQLDLEAGDEASSPTAIGAVGDFDDLGVSASSDLSLGEDSDLKLSPEGSPSDVSLVPDATGSSVDLVADSSPDVLGGGGAASDLGFEGSDLGLDSDSDLRLRDDKPKPGGSGIERDLTVSDDEELALGEDDELVLDGGSGAHGTGDTGINLGSPSDSGLNLEEEPLDLAGSSVSSLELPADDEIIELDELEGAADESTGLQADEEFQLSPSAMAPDDEEDSGSQVIALEDSEAFGGVAGALAGADVEPVLGEPGADELDEALEQAEAAPVTQPIADARYGPGIPETPYSIWNVLSLLAIVMILSVTGMLMMDLIRNMWTWNETFAASTSVMDMMISLFGLEP